MPTINESHAKSLALYGITLKNETKTSATLQLKDQCIDSKMSRALYEKLISAIDYHIQHDIKLPDITFGIEFEFVGSKLWEDLQDFNIAMFRLLKEKYFNSMSYTHNDGVSWILGRDGSIKLDNSKLINPYGYELSSPKLNLFNKDDIKTIVTVIEYCKKYLRAEVNESCGTHIHIGFKHNNIFRGSICDLLSAYSVMEKTVFDPIVPGSRRRNKYCHPTKPWPRNKYQKLSSRFCEFSYDGECNNLHFEFRQLEGTLDLQTILYWAELQTYVLYDLLDHIDNMQYVRNIMKMNIFDILFNYNFDTSLINFFLDRVIKFKSRSIQSVQ